MVPAGEQAELLARLDGVVADGARDFPGLATPHARGHEGAALRGARLGQPREGDGGVRGLRLPLDAQVTDRRRQPGDHSERVRHGVQRDRDGDHFFFLFFFTPLFFLSRCGGARAQKKRD